MLPLPSRVHRFVALVATLTSLPAAAFFVRPPPHVRSSKLGVSVPETDSEEVENEISEECFILGYEQNTAPFVTVNEVFVAEVDTLRNVYPSYESDDEPGSNVMKYHKRKQEYLSKENMEYNGLIEADEVVLVDVVRRPGMTNMSRGFVRAGPRKRLHFDPSKVNAAIITCGGLCPGLNNVIRELVRSLNYLYGVNKVFGLTGGFHGFHKPEYEPVTLTNEMVEDIHHEGGTILRSSRGGFDMDKIIDFLKKKQINQLYVIGGDGTHRGAFAIHEACLAEGMNLAVASIPKTIDNDVDYIDRSFGFISAVQAALAGIHTAKTEAMCNLPNGIGIVKLMGRSAGFLAAFAALGSGDVDLVLVPEVPIVLEGPNGILPYLQRRVKEQKFAVVVVAEGAGEELLGESTEVDAGGNKKLPKIGQYLKEEIANYFRIVGEEATIKYVDPSYMVRSVPANGADALYCTQLAQNAVHGAMAGYTGFTVGLVNNNMVYLPIPLVVASSPRTMDPHGIIWEEVIAMTGQPNTAPPKIETSPDMLCSPGEPAMW